jgi:pimeloyl-ACP methyl ester carboxylesterase
MKKLLKTLLLTSLIFSCSPSPDKIREGLAIKSSQIGFLEKTYQTQNLKIFSLQKLANENAPIDIYIEGDGRAWLSRTAISPNPTPRNLLLANIALKDSSPNVIYFARPCQFVEDNNCSNKFWTTERFSKPVIDSYKEILQQFKNRDINFIGYSGGAAVAILLASEMDNVKSIKTIAGNLDYNAFTNFHKVTPLNDEMDISSAIAKASNIPQTHYIGGKDDVITAEVFESFKSKIENYQQNSAHIKFITIPDASHHAGWEDLKW